MTSRKIRFSVRAVLTLIFAAAIVAACFQPQEISATIEVSRESPHHAPLLTMTNNGRNTIWFEGYDDTTSLGFTEAQMPFDGTWNRGWVGSCGTGMELRRLDPGESVRVDMLGSDDLQRDANFQTPVVCRVAVSCYEQNRYDSRKQDVYSESFELR